MRGHEMVIALLCGMAKLATASNCSAAVLGSAVTTLQASPETTACTATVGMLQGGPWNSTHECNCLRTISPAVSAGFNCDVNGYNPFEAQGNCPARSATCSSDVTTAAIATMQASAQTAACTATIGMLQGGPWNRAQACSCLLSIPDSAAYGFDCSINGFNPSVYRTGCAIASRQLPATCHDIKAAYDGSSCCGATLYMQTSYLLASSTSVTTTPNATCLDIKRAYQTSSCCGTTPTLQTAYTVTG